MGRQGKGSFVKYGNVELAAEAEEVKTLVQLLGDILERHKYPEEELEKVKVLMEHEDERAGKELRRLMRASPEEIAKEEVAAEKEEEEEVLQEAEGEEGGGEEEGGEVKERGGKEEDTNGGEIPYSILKKRNRE